MAGLASRAAPADTKAVCLSIGWTFVPASLEVLVNCSGAPKALRLLRMVEGRVLPHLSRRKCMGNVSQYIGIEASVAGRCVRVPS